MWYVFRYVNVLFEKKKKKNRKIKNECRMLGVYPSVKAFNYATTFKNSFNNLYNTFRTETKALRSFAMNLNYGMKRITHLQTSIINLIFQKQIIL